jgi:tripartite-type tricarboxylate transporter receptor subunit TctC
MSSKILHCLKTASAGIASAAMLLSPTMASAQNYPDKPITMFVAYAAGATTDLTARALARGAEKILGVPITVENKAGGGATVANGLLASKKPDGYHVLVTSTGSITMRPLLMKLAYTPADFTVIMQYTTYIGSLVVNYDAPWKTVDEFVEYARKNPGMSYASSGTHTQQQVAMEAFRQCKGLEFKHVPTKGGSDSNTALMGKHVDFATGSGSHLPLLKQGVFRQLVIFHANKRDPNFPDVPVMSDIGCPPTNPASGMLVVAPAKLPEPIAKKLHDAFKKAAEEPEFQKLLASFTMTYDYKDGATVTKEIPPEIEWYREYFKRTGASK